MSHESVGNRSAVARALPGMTRSRVLHRLRCCLDHPLTLLVAPAGSGKTTAMLQLAESLDCRSAWHQVDTTASSPRVMLAGLRAAVGRTVDAPLPPWDDVDQAVASLMAIPDPRPTAVFVDDLQAIAGAPSEAVVEALVKRLPPWLVFVAASRHLPGFDLADLLLTGVLVEVDADVLRWRPWEVERLFRTFYRSPLRPEEAAQLTHRTEGWVAGLQLFHLATRDLASPDREALVDRLHTSPGLVRDYLTRNVVDGLSGELRTFMVDTCVLGRLDPRLCDALRGTTDSRRHLLDLERQRLFLIPTPDGTGHRYHEVLRAYLEVSLLGRDGPVEVRARHGRAGRLLEDDGALAEAVHAYARAEQWDDAARIMEAGGPIVLADGHSHLVDRLPAALVAADPWLQLARARALVGDGDLAAAATTYRAARTGFGRSPTASTVQRELQAVQSWLHDVDEPPRSTTDCIRTALRRDPRQVGADLAANDPTSSDLLAAALAMLLAGAVDDARRLVRELEASADCELLPMAAGRLVHHLVDLAGGGDGDVDDVMAAADTFEQLGIPWLARTARALTSLQHDIDGTEPAAPSPQRVDGIVDPWGRTLLAMARGIATVVHGSTNTAWLRRATTACRDQGAPVLEAWARAFEALALAREQDQDAWQSATQARSLARSVLVPGAEAIAELAVATCGGQDAIDAMARSRALARELGLALPTSGGTRSRVQVLASTPAGLARCFGGLQLSLCGREVDVDGLKPQARAVLAMLLMASPTPVHRERLLEALWPHDDPAVTARRLPVLVSTIRRHLEPQAPAGQWSLVVRVGEAHGLRLPAGTWSDVAVFDDAVAASRHGDEDAAARSLQVAFDAWRGELLPEFGPAEWVVGPREHYSLAFARVAHRLARHLLDHGEPGACVDVARAGLHADRYSCALWQLVVRAHRRMGDPAAAARTEADRNRMLAELHVEEAELAGGHPVTTASPRAGGQADPTHRRVRNSTVVMATSSESV